MAAIENNERSIQKALVRAVGSRNVSDDAVLSLAKDISSIRQKIRGINVCERGICIDYFIDANDWWSTLPELVTVGDGRVRRIEIFPWGIIEPDLFQVRIEHDFGMM